MSVQPFLIGEGWMEVRDGNDSVRVIFDRHYSRYVYADGRKPKLFMGPGEKLVLMTADGGAICAWRRFISMDKQEGVNCAIFRREHGDLASALLATARGFAERRWAGERLYTYINPKGVRPTMVKGPRGHFYPVYGYCFYQDGWTFAGLTKGGLHILERCPTQPQAEDKT